jgi:tRNA-splicing ligase RtcB
MERPMKKLAPKLLSWASICDEQTRQQAMRTSTLPFIYPHVALMSDCHLGKGATVGSVIPTLGAIIPAAVGVDIGCGMIAVRSQFTARDVRVRGDLAALRESIETAIPLSAGQYNADVHDAATQRRIADLEEYAGADSAEMISPNWRLQLGSLGSGGQAHRDRQGSGQALVDSAGRPRSGLPGGGHRGVLGLPA